VCLWPKGFFFLSESKDEISHRPTRTHTDERFFPPATLPEVKLCALRAADLFLAKD
jgi:hypothetical protein